MNCRAIQRHLLTLDDPGRPPAAAEQHLEGCAGCRDWLHRLLQLERHVPLLPVPASRAKAELKQLILTGKKVRAVADPTRPYWKRHAPALGLAASVALLAACAAALLWGPWIKPAPVGTRPLPDPLLTNLMRRNLSLAQAETPLTRVVTLAELADDLQGEMGPLAAVGERADLKKLATWYDQVVQNGLVPQGKTLPAGQRQAILEPIVGRLQRTERDARKLALDHPACAEPLTALANAAWLGHKQLGSQYTSAALSPAPTLTAAVGRQSRPLSVGLVGVILAAKAEPARPARSTGKVKPPAPPAIVVEQAQRFQRNHGLIGSLVEGGLRLATKTSPLDRAETCFDVAERLAEEIQQAAEKGEGPRADELGEHLHSLLKIGLASNLRLACLRTPVDSPGNQELLRIGRRVVTVTEPLEGRLQEAASTPMQRAMKSVSDGRTEVERALQDRGPLREEE